MGMQAVDVGFGAGGSAWIINMGGEPQQMSAALNPEKLIDPLGELYRGYQTRTRRGYTCQNWGT